MEIRPAPLHRVPGGGSAGPGLVVLAPIIALLIVVTAAWAGASLEAVSEPLPSSDPGADGLSLGAPSALNAVFPARAFGIQVMTGPELVAARGAGTVRRELVAVSGILRSEPLPLSCPATYLTLSRTFCHRLAALFPLAPPAESSAGTSGAPVQVAADLSGPQVAGHLLPSTPVPPVFAVETQVGPWLSQSVPVIVVGRYEDQRAPACTPGRAWCRDDLVVEQIVWAAGTWQDPSVVRDPALTETRHPGELARLGEITKRTAGRHELIIALAVMRRDLLAVVDPLAARSVATGGSGGVWYVRSIVSPPGGQPQVVWAVIEDGTGTVLGYSLPQR